MNIAICSRCIYDEKTPGINFDNEGVCNYCRQIEDLEKEFGTGTEKGEKVLNDIIQEIKRTGKNKKYDCVIGVSGGTDSSFLLAKSIEWGLRPLAVHYDNTWNSSIATENMRKVTMALKVDLFTYVINNKESDDIFRSFFLAGVPEFDACTDLGFAQVLRKAAVKNGVKYILEGHSFKAEGISPMGKNYFDGKYIQSIHRKYGKMKMKTFPLMTFAQFLKWIIIYRQKFVRPLWYIEYSKAEAMEFLTNRFGWTYYGNHHLENRSSSFVHQIYHPQKFGMDNRNWSLSAEVRSGVRSRSEALGIYNSPIIEDPELVEYVKKRLVLSDAEYNNILNSTGKTFKDFKTYKKRFERWRPFFFLMAKINLVPMSFYLKYCFPLKDK